MLKKITAVISLKSHKELVYWYWDPKAKIFRPLDDSALAQVIPSYRKLHEKARCKARIRYLEHVEVSHLGR